VIEKNIPSHRNLIMTLPAFNLEKPPSSSEERSLDLAVGSSALAGLPTSVQIQRSRKWVQKLRRMQAPLYPRTREGATLTAMTDAEERITTAHRN
jgi:hypothetical protein